jgi:hypothetical protein
MMTDDARAIARKAIGNVKVKVGDNVLGIGLDDYCLPCITYVTIESRDNDGYIIKTREQNPIRILVYSIKDYFPDTLQNRYIIRNACKQICEEHFKEVKKQFS